MISLRFISLLELKLTPPVKIIFPPMKHQRQFSSERSFTVQVYFFPNPVHRKCLFSPHVFVCTHQSAARPRLLVENPRPERAACREACSNLKAGGPPFISAVFERVARGGGRGVISVEPPLLGEASKTPRIPKYGSFFHLGYSRLTGTVVMFMVFV